MLPKKTRQHRIMLTITASAATSASILTGCGGEGGAFFTNDRHTYVSTAWRPWTVTLVDTRNGEAVWSADVPVGKQLAVQFRKGAGPNENKPDMMDWEIKEAGRGGTLTNQIPVPGEYARRLEPTLRPTPEQSTTPPPPSH